MNEEKATSGEDANKPEKRIRKPMKPKSRGRRIGNALWSLGKLVVLLVAIGLVLFAMSGKSVKAPDWMRVRIEEQLNVVVTDGAVKFQALDLKFEKGFKPTVTVRNLVLSNTNGAVVARAASVSASLSFRALLQGEVLPSDVRMNRASLNLRRARNGEFDLGFGVKMGDGLAKTTTLAELLDSVDRAFETPVLAAIETIELSDLTLNFSDARARRGWLITQGWMRLSQDDETIGIGLGFGLGAGSVQSTTAALTFETQKGSAGAKFGVTVQRVSARDMASQIPALAWLEVLDAPISGALRTEIGEDGLLGVMNGTLEIGEGALRPTEEVKAIKFDSARAYFGYDPKAQKIRFDELSVQTDAGKIVAEGQGYLREVANGVPKVMLGQFRILEMAANPEGVFAAPVAFTGGATDLRLRLDPFTLNIGQAVIEDDGYSYLVKGDIRADSVGWHVAMDAKSDKIDPDRLLALWPVEAVVGTRRWLEENINAARLFNVSAALRANTGEKPKMAVGFEFAEADVRFMKTLPSVKNGSGHAGIVGDVFTLVVEQGQVIAPQGGALDATGTVFQIPDINIKGGPPAIVSLKVKGPIHAAMSLLDEPPFKIMTKAGQPVDLATGQAEVSAEIRLRLVKKLLLEDIDYDVTAALRNVRSDKLVEGRVLTAAKLGLTATPRAIEISGTGLLGKVPVQGRWHQGLGDESKGRSRLEGTVELSQRFVTEFGIGLPKGSISGTGVGQIGIDLVRGEDPKFHLLSDLNRVGLRLSDLGWSLPKNGKGRLEVSGTLGTPARIDKLVIEGAGLRAIGAVTLRPDGALKSAKFSRVRLAGWLDAPIELIGRGAGATPSVRISGGVIDTRKTTFSSGASRAGAGGKMTVALDRLIISEGITLTSFRGDFTRRTGFKGSFRARVNGKAPITGIVVPSKGGSSFRIKSDDAGAVFRSAGVIEKVHGGTLDMSLVPRKGAQGQYNGRLKGELIRVRGAPAMADLLGAISLIGLLEQLNGQGIVFSNYEANFRLTPKQIIVTSSSAIGASMGVSMDGVYNLGPGTLDMQGVLSPIYFLNGIGRIFTRKGEGLLGFNYRLRGTSSDPKVRVNPLSILTPGMFREIFKRRPPKVEK